MAYPWTYIVIIIFYSVLNILMFSLFSIKKGSYYDTKSVNFNSVSKIDLLCSTFSQQVQHWLLVPPSVQIFTVICPVTLKKNFIYFS